MEFESRVVKLSTGALQDLWDAIREACAAQHAVTIDLEGASFSGRAVGLQIALCEGTKATYDKAFNIAPKYPLTIQGGRIDLGHYSILVSGGSCCFKQVEISGSGPAWRQRTLASLMHATGRMTTLRLEDTTLHSSAQGPTNTLLVDNAAHVTLLRSKVCGYSGRLLPRGADVMQPASQPLYLPFTQEPFPLGRCRTATTH